MQRRNLKALKMQLLRRWKDNRIIRIAVLVFLALAAAVSIWQGARNAVEFSQDFQWDAAKALAEGIDPYELSHDSNVSNALPAELAEFYRMFTDRGLKQEMEANQFPSLLMLLFPMTLFDPFLAKVIWLVLNLLFSAGIIILLRKTFFENADICEYSVVALLMLAGTPYRNQLGVGQHTLFAFFFFMLAVYLDKTDKNSGFVRSILISFCLFVSYFKYTLTGVLALYFLYRKRYKELAVSVAAHVILTEVFALRLGKSFWYMIKAPLEVASNLASEGGIDLGVFIKSPFCYIPAFIIAVLLVIISVKIPEKNECLLFSTLVLWSLILTYHRTYDFFVLSAVSAVFCTKDGTAKEESTPAMFTVYAILLAAAYFGLRVFNENTGSKIVVGIIYYSFTVALTYIAVKRGLKGND